MKLALERDALLAALSHAHRIVIKNDTIPILTTVMIRAEADRLAIMATNLDIVAETSCAADVEREGETAIPLAPLVALLQKLPAGTPLRMEQAEPGAEMAIRYRRSSISLPTQDPTLLTRFSPPEGVAPIDLPAALVVSLLETPAHVADANSAWAFGVGVHLHFDKEAGSIVGVAATMARMTRVMAPASDLARGITAITIPLKAVSEIVKLAKGVGDGTVSLIATDTLLSVEAGGTRLCTKLVEATFPAYRQIIPTERPTRAMLASGELRSALDRALILADDRDRIVRIEIADGVLSVTSRAQRGGAVSETVEAEGGHGMGFRVNASLMVEALDALGGDVVELSAEGAGLPVVMTRPGSWDVTCIVMPMKI